MATKIQVLVVATLIWALGAINDSNDEVATPSRPQIISGLAVRENIKEVSPAVAKEVAAAVKDDLNMEEPFLEDVKRHLHHKSLLRTQPTVVKGAAILQPDGADDGAWASDFEKDVSDLVLGLSAGGMGATPGMNDAVNKIKDLIEKDMIPKVKAAHKENQDELNRIYGVIEGCGSTRVTELAAAQTSKNDYVAASKNHKECRGEEASAFNSAKDCHQRLRAKGQDKANKCKIWLDKSDKFGADNSNQQTVKRAPAESVESYLIRITSTICGKPLNCATCGTASGAAAAGAGDNGATSFLQQSPEFLTGTTNTNKYTWLGGDSGGGYLDEFMRTKKDCDEAAVAYNLETIECKRLDAELLSKRESCDNMQDTMDTHSCKWSVDEKDACEKYEGCYSQGKTSYDTSEKDYKELEKDRKAEWKGLMRMMCILEAFGAPGGINETAIQTCKAKTHDISHLVLVYKMTTNFIAEVDCEPPKLYPNTAEYKAAEYNMLPVVAMGKAEANECAGFVPINTVPADGVNVPDGCKCTRVPMNGPYSAGPIVKCVNCKDVYDSTQANSCPAGTKLFSPRTYQDWHSFVGSMSGMEPVHDPNWIIDITRPLDGCYNDKCDVVMNAASSQTRRAPENERWRTADGSSWWLRNTTLAHTAPTDPTVAHVGIATDYKANCYLDLGKTMPANALSVKFHEDGCNYHSKSYYCQPKDESLKPKIGSPPSCTCKKIAIVGSYSAGEIVKCEKCWDVSKSLDINSCPNGYKIFSPSSRADWKVALDSILTPVRNPSFIVDVTRPQDGCGGCTQHAMNSGTPAQATWGTSDHTPWWLMAEPYSQPSKGGDYKANCYMDFWRDAVNPNAIHFADHACNAHSRSYYCQPASTTTTTTTTAAHCGSYTCPTKGYLKKPGVNGQLNPTEDTCCEKGCTLHECGDGWLQRTLEEMKHLAGSTDEKCCLDTCKRFTCPDGWIKRDANLTLTVDPSNTACCEVTCKLHTCSAGKVKKANSDGFLGQNDDMCCEADPNFYTKLTPSPSCCEGAKKYYSTSDTECAAIESRCNAEPACIGYETRQAGHDAGCSLMTNKAVTAISDKPEYADHNGNLGATAADLTVSPSSTCYNWKMECFARTR